MNFAKRILMVAGAGTLAGILAITIAPQTAHGFVAALVQISNTAAAPAITLDVSRTASQNVQLYCGQVCLQILPDGTYGANYIVPAGSSLVITTVQINTTGSNDVSLYQVNSSGQSRRAGGNFAAGGSFQFQYPSGIVLSSGSNLFMYAALSPPFEAFLSGYLVSN